MVILFPIKITQGAESLEYVCANVRLDWIYVFQLSSNIILGM
jgi:hypothetical protein